VCKKSLRAEKNEFLSEEQFVILRGCIGKEKEVAKWEFVILSVEKDLVAASVIEVLSTRSFTLFRMTNTRI
jgi:hypothetical protein